MKHTCDFLFRVVRPAGLARGGVHPPPLPTGDRQRPVVRQALRLLRRHPPTASAAPENAQSKGDL